MDQEEEVSGCDHYEQGGGRCQSLIIMLSYIINEHGEKYIFLCDNISKVGSGSCRSLIVSMGVWV